MSRLVLFVTGLAALASCAPSLLWSRHTDDRSLTLEVRRSGGGVWMDAVPRDGGGPGPPRLGPFDEIAIDHAVFVEDGRHFAIPARRGHDWFVLHDLAIEPAGQGVGALLFDGRGRHLAYAVEDAGRWRFVVDGRPGPAVSALGEAMAFSEDGERTGYVAFDDGPAGCARVVTGARTGPCWRDVLELAVGCAPEGDAYVATDGAGKVIVRGGETVGRFEDVADLRAARCGARWAASVRQDGAWRVLVDGVAQPAATRIDALSFAPGGLHVVYTAERDGWRVNVDGRDGERFDGVSPPAVSADGSHVAYVGARGGLRWLVVDGRATPAPPSATGLALAPDGARVAFVAGSAAHPTVVCDGVAYPFSLVIEGTLTFSRDGRHWAVLAGDLARRALFVAVDGVPRAPIEARELFGGGLPASTAGAAIVLRRWVAAELERSLAERRPG